jgi:hypothetical protein
MRTVADWDSPRRSSYSRRNALTRKNVVGPVGLEPTTYGLKVRPRACRTVMTDAARDRLCRSAGNSLSGGVRLWWLMPGCPAPSRSHDLGPRRPIVARQVARGVARQSLRDGRAGVLSACPPGASAWSGTGVPPAGGDRSGVVLFGRHSRSNETRAGESRPHACYADEGACHGEPDSVRWSKDHEVGEQRRSWSSVGLACVMGHAAELGFGSVHNGIG